MAVRTISKACLPVKTQKKGMKDSSIECRLIFLITKLNLQLFLLLTKFLPSNVWFALCEKLKQ